MFGNFLDRIESSNPEIIESKSILESQDTTEESALNLTKPMFVLFLISTIIVLITFRDFRNNRQTKVLDILLISITSIIGLLISYLWFFSDHEADIKRLADLVSVMANCFSKQTFQSISQRCVSYALTHRDKEATLRT